LVCQLLLAHSPQRILRGTRTGTWSTM
jgi:hypothetical protein